MRWQELQEARQAPLYHTMDARKAFYCFDNDAMPARWKHVIDGREVMGNSFSRNPNYEHGGRPVRFVVDQQMLATRHKIIPVDGERAFRTTANAEEGSSTYSLGKGMRDRNINQRRLGSDGALQEEFVVGDIRDLSRFIQCVELCSPDFYMMTGADAVRLLDEATAYADKHQLDRKFHPKFIENVEEIKQRWVDEEAEENERYHKDDE